MDIENNKPEIAIHKISMAGFWFGEEAARRELFFYLMSFN